MRSDRGLPSSTGASGRASSSARKDASPKTSRRSASAATAPVHPSATPPPIHPPATPPDHPARPLTNRGPGSFVDAQPAVRPLTARTLHGATETAPLASPCRPHSSRRFAASPANAGTVSHGGHAAPLSGPDVSNLYKLARADAVQRNRRFGLIFGFIVLFLLVGTAATLLIFGWLNPDPGNAAAKAEYETWRQTNLTTMRNRSASLAMAFNPITNDLPQDRSSAELIVALTDRYAPVLSAVGVRYLWCRKNWTWRDRNFALNIAPTGTTEFLQTPAHGAPLGDPLMLTNIQGEPSCSGVATLYWDADRNAPVGVLTLTLGPATPAPRPGEPPVKTIPSTQYTVFVDVPPLPTAAQAWLDGRLAAGMSPRPAH